MGICFRVPPWRYVGSLECHSGKITLIPSIYFSMLNVFVVQNIGSLASYPISPYLTDGLGRRYTILVGAVIMCIATAIQTAAQSIGMFIGAR